MTTSSPWIAERANLTQLRELANHVDIMTKGCESICPGASIYSLKSAFNRQATKFMVRFHSERLNKLLLILDAEPWRQTDVPATFQQLVDHIADKGVFKKICIFVFIVLKIKFSTKKVGEYVPLE
ncbi:hypothetical protein AAG570_006472 [Ranatra chinensis]|uniref:Uncharacterized protein n=1 Tax=Ranatra chinensis TaxID=642074 RepID=A0ABD0YU33_9HEMI